VKTVIVTGANGFIGSALCRKFAENNVRVLAFVKEKSDRVDGLHNVKVFKDNFGGFENLDKVIGDEHVDEFYHLAWAGVSNSFNADYNVQLSNIKASCEAINACHRIGCKRFIFASSIMIYEIAALMEHEITPNKSTLYKSAKLAADYMTRTLAGSLGIDYIRGIVSNVYGPGERSPRLINTTIRKIINGEHCAFSSGTQKYDFIYIDDAINAFIKIGEVGKNNKTYYIGSLNPRPLKELLLELRDVVDKDAKMGFGEMEFNGVSLTYEEFDINAIKDDTGLIPEVDFKEGIRRTAEWIRENG
jgi:NAD-dependent epimerase/dehydratase